MKLKIEKSTDFFGKTEYIVMFENDDPIAVKCIGIVSTLEEAEKIFNDALTKVQKPIRETIQEQIL